VAFPEEIKLEDSKLDVIADSRFYEPPYEKLGGKKGRPDCETRGGYRWKYFPDYTFFRRFFLIIPILIKVSSKGPVFFTQQRVGQGGKRFAFLKFRSMYINNDSSIHREYIKKMIDGVPDIPAIAGTTVFKIQNDPA